MKNLSGTPLLRVENLRVWFDTEIGPARAVDGVSFSIQPGETYALVGESGSGKSVTALAIMNLLPSSTGRIKGGKILFEGVDLARASGTEMRRIRGKEISMIFQEPMSALNPVFTVGRQIAEVFCLHEGMNRKTARNASIEILELVGIPEPADRFNNYPHELSGGMQQRVMIAMALACKPKLLIADEPTTALDVTIQSQILTLIDDLRKKTGTAVLLITHDMGVVRENADRVGVMYAGKLVEEAPVESLFSDPAHPYTELLMRALPAQTHRQQKLYAIEGLVPKATTELPGCRFENRCPARMDCCITEPPPNCEAGPEHTAACHLLSGRTPRNRLEITPSAAPPSPLDPSVIQLQTDGLQLFFPLKKNFFGRGRGDVRAVDGVSLRVHKGETLALVGESGCGKTTVGKSIIRLCEPTGGSVRFKNTDLSGLGKQARKTVSREIQFVFQDPFSSLDPRQPIGDILIEGMEIHRIRKNRKERLVKAQELLERVGLSPDMIYRYPHEFSGGQRQRIVLARALSTGPELLICDEATSALDVSVQAQILNLLKDLQAEFKLACIFITHNLGVVQYLADRVAVMYLGRIVEEGATKEIFSGPKHPYTQALLSAAPQVSKDVVLEKIILKGDVPSPVHPPKGCHFHPRCPQALPACSLTYPDSVSFSPTHSCRCILYQTLQ
ncbi:MAG: ABC transporter ATP-binding protein [Pontiellaceae bacterium]|jgi:peptide/nickel transport system ATP-binding protein|nr:ABC transporter ATP-binding protein [Pontiellaceae bacterium]